MDRHDRPDRWHKADPNEAHSLVMAHVEALERHQEPIRERWYQLACLYDPYLAFEGDYLDNAPGLGQVAENLIASNVDTVTAIAAAAEVRPRFVTDGAPWKEQRKAKDLAYYAQGLMKKFDVHKHATAGFKECAIKGTGLVKVWKDEHDELRIEKVMVDDIVVDERECRNGSPRQFHHRALVDRDQLIDRYEQFEDEIEHAHAERGAGETGLRYWADAIEIGSNQIMLLESWYLPSGKRKGRHTIVIDGVTLLDEEYTENYFPFARIVWSERHPGYYGIGGAERIAGHQRRLNKYNWQLDKIIDKHAMPTTWAHISDIGDITVERHSLGNLAGYKVKPPETIFPPAMNPDMLLRRSDLKDSGYEEFGMSRLAAGAKKPAGIESGVAIREYRDATTQRFALQERALERFVLDIVWLAIAVCKKLGKKAPEVYSKTRRKKFAWSEVEMHVVFQQLEPANNLPTTPAGRRQLAVELSQAGLIGPEESRRLLGPTNPLDVEAAMSPYTAAVDHADWEIEEVISGNRRIPQSYGGLEIAKWRFQQAYLREDMNGAPDQVLEDLRTWINLAADIIAREKALTAPAPMMPGMDPMAGAPMDPMAGPMPGGPPVGPALTPAMSPQAMQLQPQ